MKTNIFSIAIMIAIVVSLNSCYSRTYTYASDSGYGYSSTSRYDRYERHDDSRVTRRGVTVETQNPDISYNLDLRAVADVFADSRNLEEFERRINDYDSRINNLDLNMDGQVDYLRVIETNEGNTHLVVLQAVLGIDIFQDVASIVVERRNRSRVYVQVIGDPYLYGPRYIIEPIYVYTPTIFSFFWGPSYRTWYSPYYWGYYPTYYRYYSPYATNIYINNINIYVDNSRTTYRYSDNVRSNDYYDMRSSISRRDYENAHPNNSFVSRNSRANVNSRRELDRVMSPNARSNRNSNVNSSRSNSRSSSVSPSRSSSSRSTRVSPNRSSSSRSSSSVSPSRSSSSRSTTVSPSRSSSSRSSSSVSPSRSSSSRSTTVSPSRSSSSRSSSSVSPSRSSSSRSTTVSPSRSSSSRSSSSGSPRNNYSRSSSGRGR